MDPLIVDADGHVIEPDDMWPQYLAGRWHAGAPKRVKDEYGVERVLLDGRLMPAASQANAQGGPDGALPSRRPGGHDPTARLRDLDEEGIDVSVLYPTGALRFAGLGNVALATALSRAYNDWLADFCRVAPSRLVGVGVIPVQDVDTSVGEARRVVSHHGFKAIFLRPNPIGGRPLYDPAYEDLWAAVQDLGVPIAFHEGTTMNVPTAGADRYVKHWHQHMISHPHEQQMALLSLIAGGVMERYPRLRFAFLESGCGWIAHWLERMDEHVEYFNWEVEGLSMKPSEYFRRQGYISSDPLEKTLPAMAELVSPEVLVWATDYPHPDALFPGAARAIRNRTDLAEPAKTKILGENAARLYGLAIEPWTAGI